MKKIMWSLITFVLIIISGILSLSTYKQSSKEISTMVKNTSAYVQSNDWSSAKSQIEKIDKKWGQIEKKWTMLIDHLEIDQIEISLKKSQKYIETKNSSDSLAELANLQFMVEHIYDKESFKLENIF